MSVTSHLLLSFPSPPLLVLSSCFLESSVVQFNVLGALYATLRLLLTSHFLLMVQPKQKELGLTSIQLLSNIMLPSALLITLLAPLLDSFSVFTAEEESGKLSRLTLTTVRPLLCLSYSCDPIPGACCAFLCCILYYTSFYFETVVFEHICLHRNLE